MRARRTREAAGSGRGRQDTLPHPAAPRRLLPLATLAVAATLTAAPLPAQLPHLLPPDSPWLDVNYPKLFWTPREGFTAGAYFAFIRQLSLEDTELPPPYAAAIGFDGQISTSGSRYLTFDSRFPHLAPGWRFSLTLTGARHARENYFGVGPNTAVDDALVTDAREHYYRARQTRWVARGQIQRALAGGLRVLAGVHLERWRLDPLQPTSLLAMDAASGDWPSIGQSTDDFTARFGLVFDTRDDEVAANRGVLLEAIHGRTTGGDASYTRTTGSAAAFFPIGENLVLGARAAGQRMTGSPPLGSYFLIESSDRPYTGLGGGLSHRGLPENRFLGRHKLLFNLDARYHVVNVPRTARLTLMAFLDAGRVFETQPFELTAEGMKTGGGVGLYLQFTRGGILGSTLGLGPEGLVVDATTKWIY